MSAPARPGRESRRIELQLDTAQLVLVVAMLLGLGAISFYLGRWVERDRWTGGAGGRPGARVTETDAGADLTFFDTLGGKSGARPEPERQASKPANPATPARSPEGANGESQQDSPGAPNAQGFAVQVFSGEKAQAQTIASALARKGYQARVVPVAPGSSTMRVRVYGYRTRQEADSAAARIRRDERLEPWVVKAE